jgi:hypothetical protein
LSLPHSDERVAHWQREEEIITAEKPFYPVTVLDGISPLE